MSDSPYVRPQAASLAPTQDPASSNNVFLFASRELHGPAATSTAPSRVAHLSEHFPVLNTWFDHHLSRGSHDNIAYRVQALEVQGKKLTSDQVRTDHNAIQNARFFASRTNDFEAFKHRFVFPANGCPVNLNQFQELRTSLDSLSERFRRIEHEHDALTLLDRARAGGINNLTERLTKVEAQQTTNRDDPSVAQFVVSAGDAVLQSFKAGRGRGNREPEDDTTNIRTQSVSNKRPLDGNPEPSPANIEKRARIAPKESASGDQQNNLVPSPSPTPALNNGDQPSIPAPGRRDHAFDQPIWDFFNFLKRMDCTRDEDIYRLRKYVNSKISLEFPICSDFGHTNIEFFLKVGGTMSTKMTSHPEDLPEQPKEDEEEVEDLNIHELHLDDLSEWRAFKNRLGFVSYFPPRYLVSLGEVYAANRGLNKAPDVYSTNFFVMMDVTSPEKALWLIYRYERLFERKDGIPWETVEFSKLYKSTHHKFDIVRLLGDVRDWRNPAEDMVAMDWFKNSLPRKTFMVRPVFFLPVLKQLRKALEEGWERQEGVCEEE
ncbi:hypothetical protein N0V88_001585 [Collariella sp. IMI 366227]|nr:hypothetical protein N0V88_001585 [Collariella sp. IMI 366227]